MGPKATVHTLTGDYDVSGPDFISKWRCCYIR